VDHRTGHGDRSHCHLLPDGYLGGSPEAANIADRASRGRDNQIVSAAADLALSCLNNAHALNPNEIARAILQCKEQSDQMLEKACLAVENAATGGGVYPEVMFEVARHWYDLYKRHAPPGTLPRDDDHSVPPPARPPMVSEGLPMATQPSVTMAQNQNNLSNSISSFPLGHMSQMNAASIAGMQAFPAVYSLIQGYPGLPAPNNLPLHMYVGPPPHHILPVPTSMPGPGAGIAGQFPGIHPNMHGLQMFNNVSEAGPRFNMAGGPLFHLSLPNMPNLPGISMGWAQVQHGWWSFVSSLPAQYAQPSWYLHGPSTSQPSPYTALTTRRGPTCSPSSFCLPLATTSSPLTRPPCCQWQRPCLPEVLDVSLQGWHGCLRNSW